MQFVPGPTLGQLLAARQLAFAPNQVKLWAKDLLHTLAYLHGHNPTVVHHDIKPGNLKLLPDGSVALLDFGLAQFVGHSKPDELSDTLLAYTPNYAPPEQIMGQPTAGYSDIYALGATLYHLVTGRWASSSESALVINCESVCGVPLMILLIGSSGSTPELRTCLERLSESAGARAHSTNPA